MAEGQQKIPVVVYVLGFVVGAISAYAVTPEWLNWISAPVPEKFGRVAAIFGGVAGCGGGDQRESIFRGLLWLVLAAGYTWLIITLITLLPLEQFWLFVAVAIVMVPMVVGGFAGVLVFNLWKARVR